MGQEDRTPSGGNNRHKGRRGAKYGILRDGVGGFQQTFKVWQILSRGGRERVRKKDDSKFCNSRDWKTNDAIIRHRDIREKS